ncbi:t-SNARE [Phaeosphaeria sp. MPI-PUGE-AT-0046c]|nr:t-SNARE [Phaeosphaeria sp. MPI-PUGE-AT-0046c]
MSQNYQQYNSNPYGQAEAGYGGSNPYGDDGGYGQQNQHAGGYGQATNAHSALQHQDSQASQYSQDPASGAHGGAHHNQPGAPLQHGTQPMSRDDYLQRIESVKAEIGRLTSDVQSIANIHQRMLSSPDNRSSAELEAIVTQTQIRNTSIKDQIRFLEGDASRGGDSFKGSQVQSLKRSFKAQLESFQKEEADYSKRYRDAIGRQYRIINPEATDAEVNEAANADWGDEGIFTQALKSNRSGQANSVLGAVRARHNDIQRIEKTMSELALLFQQLNEQVVYQEPQVQRAEEQTEQVIKDSEHANQQLTKGIDSAKRARKLKWITLWVVVAIIAILALVLGIYFGYVVPQRNK